MRNHNRIPSSTKYAIDDQAPGTSTEDDFLQDIQEQDLLAAEERRKDYIISQQTSSRQIRLFVSVYEYITLFGKKRSLMKQMLQATSYSQWKTAATTMDSYLGLEPWKSDNQSSFYDYILVSKITRRLKRYRNLSQELHIYEIIKILKNSLSKSNTAGITNERMYSFTYFGTKHIIDEYVDETIQSLEYVAKSNILTTQEKRSVFKLFSKTYGRTALCLSGGGTIAYYHIGIIKALMESRVLPSVFTGSSAGSLIAAIVCVRTDEEIENDLFDVDVIQPHHTACESSLRTRLEKLWKTGAFFTFQDWFKKVQWFTKGTMTFMEAFVKTGRILNISVVSEERHSEPKLLNYITAPDVIIASAVVASSAIPGLLLPVELLQKNSNGDIVPFRGSGKRWRDGSLRTDIPERELNQLFNVQFTIVSQMNPHIVLFFYNSRGSSGNPVIRAHGKGYRGGFIGSSLVQHFKLDMQKWLILLRDTDLLPPFNGIDLSNVWLQRFEGNVTLTPPTLGISDFINILSDPSKQRLKYQIEMGQLQCWPKIRIIENRIRIEQSLAYWRHNLSGEKSSKFQLKLISEHDNMDDGDITD